MKKKIVYSVLLAVIAVTAFFVGKNFTEQPTQLEPETIRLNEIKGWETWENTEEVGLEIQGDQWIYTIEKDPYTADKVEINRLY